MAAGSLYAVLVQPGQKTLLSQFFHHWVTLLSGWTTLKTFLLLHVKSLLCWSLRLLAPCRLMVCHPSFCSWGENIWRGQCFYHTGMQTTSSFCYLGWGLTFTECQVIDPLRLDGELELLALHPTVWVSLTVLLNALLLPSSCSYTIVAFQALSHFSTVNFFMNIDWLTMSARAIPALCFFSCWLHPTDPHINLLMLSWHCHLWPFQ
jgi:hypothetical protein